MNPILLLLGMYFLCIPSSFSEVKKDTIPQSAKFSGMIQVTNNGISLVPAFSLDKPALLAFLDVSKKRFSYSPQFSFDYKARPWFMNQWLRYRLIEGKKVDFRTSVGYAFLYKTTEELKAGSVNEIIKIDRNVISEQLLTYKMTSNNSLTLSHLHGIPTSSDGITLDLLTLGATLGGINLGKQFEMTVSPSIFYLSYTGDNEGVFSTQNIMIKKPKSTFGLSFQATEPLMRRNLVVKDFNWNVALVCFL
jgi:hypothetical protein